MAKFFKLLAWFFIIGLTGYIIYGFSGDGVSGKAIQVRQEAGVDVLSFAECMDLDGGKNYDKQSSTYNTYDNLVYDDYCEDEDVLAEYFCNNAYPDRVFIKCDCFKGYCRS